MAYGIIVPWPGIGPTFPELGSGVLTTGPHWGVLEMLLLSHYSRWLKFRCPCIFIEKLFYKNNAFFFCGSPVSLASSFQFVESYSSTSSDHFRVCQGSVSFSSLSCPPSSSFKDFMHAAYTYILTVSSIVFSSGLSYEQCNQAGEEEPHRTSIYFEPLMHCVFFLIHVTFHS